MKPIYYHFPVGSEQEMAELIRLAANFLTGPGINISQLPSYKLSIYQEFFTTLNKYKTEEFKTINFTKCQCGSEKLGYTQHSDWCEKFNG